MASPPGAAAPLPKSIGVAQNTSLADLNTIVAQNEAVLGPLSQIGHGPFDGADVTILVFDTAADPPANAAVLRQCIGGVAPVVPGATLICTGDCYVSGALMTLAALRPN